MHREKLLKELMEVDFFIIELNLYLNTHPYDNRAILTFNNLVKKSLELRHLYEKKYGLLTARLSPSSCPWQWVKDSQTPWPWET